MDSERIREAVRESYGAVARGQASSCGTGCCSPGTTSRDASARLGYSADELDAVPEGANLGLGCGNPQAIASLRAGEVVLDLGSGGGFDCFLASRQVGATGRVVGVDMTADMIALARHNAVEIGASNVEFRLGEIEHLPVADASVDVILSNCVINLSPDKAQVFREAFRVLKPGGRLAIADVVASLPLPDDATADLEALTGCVAGAATVDALEAMLADAGFTDVRIAPKDESRSFIREWTAGAVLGDYVLSATIEGRKR